MRLGIHGLTQEVSNLRAFITQVSIYADGTYVRQVLSCTQTVFPQSIITITKIEQPSQRDIPQHVFFERGVFLVWYSVYRPTF